jgi:predicted dehydrogenase
VKKLNVAAAGLNFGANFAVCYKFHPLVGELSVCDLNPDLLNKAGDRLDIQKRFYRLEAVAPDPAIDAVHHHYRYPQLFFRYQVTGKKGSMPGFR